MAHRQQLDRVWEIIGKVPACLLVTAFSGGLRARPLQPRPEREAGLIWFVIDVRGAKDDEVAAKPDVCLVFVDEDEKAYLSVSGTAGVLHDPAKAAEIWRSTDTVWWPGGPDDPNARVLRVEPKTAELWDGPASRLIATYEFAKARITGDKPNLGENRKVTVPM